MISTCILFLLVATAHSDLINGPGISSDVYLANFHGTKPAIRAYYTDNRLFSMLDLTNVRSASVNGIAFPSGNPDADQFMLINTNGKLSLIRTLRTSTNPVFYEFNAELTTLSLRNTPEPGIELRGAFYREDGASRRFLWLPNDPSADAYISSFDSVAIDGTTGLQKSGL